MKQTAESTRLAMVVVYALLVVALLVVSLPLS